MDPLSVHFFSDHITLTSIPASQRRTIRRSRPLFNWLTQEPHLASSRQWCPSPWVSQLCFCGAFWPAGACTLLLLAPPTSRGRPLCMGYVPLGFRAGQSVNNIRFNCKKKKTSDYAGSTSPSSSYPLVAPRPLVQWVEIPSWPSQSSACWAFLLIWRFLSRHCQDRPWRLFRPGCWPPVGKK